MIDSPPPFPAFRGRFTTGSASVCLAVFFPMIVARAQDTTPAPVPPLAEDSEAPAGVDTSEASPAAGPATPLPPVDQPLPPLVEPLPVPTVDGTEPLPPLDGMLPIPPSENLTPLAQDPLALPLEETAIPPETTEDSRATFEGSGFGGLPGVPSGFLGNPFGRPNGFGGMGGVGSGFGSERLLAGFHATANLSGTYNTNVNPNGRRDSDSSRNDSDFILGLGGSLSYMSTAPRFTFGGSYNGNYSQYLNQSDLSGYSQGGNLTANYNGGKFNASFNTGLSYDRGSNRYYDSEFVGVFNVSTGLNLRYTISPKTTIQGNLSTSFSSTSDGDFSNSGTLDAGISGLYRYSPKTEFGPGIHYGYQSAEGDNARTSVGPTMTLNYKLSSLIAMNSTVGLDFSSYEDGGSTDTSFTGSLGLNYTPSALWGMNLSFYKGMQPDTANSAAYIDTTSVSVGYHRQIRRANLSLNGSYNFDSSDDGGGAANTNGDDGGSWTLSSSLGMGIFANFCQASISASYSNQGGGSSGESYSSSTIGFSVSKSF